MNGIFCEVPDRFKNYLQRHHHFSYLYTVTPLGLLLNSVELFSISSYYFHHSQRHGQGRMTFTNGNIYTGKFDHDMITGEGEMRYKNGGRYNGAWRNGKVRRCGIMMSLLPWCNIQHHGYGIRVYFDKSTYNGQFIAWLCLYVSFFKVIEPYKAVTKNLRPQNIVQDYVLYLQFGELKRCAIYRSQCCPINKQKTLTLHGIIFMMK